MKKLILPVLLGIDMLCGCSKNTVYSPSLSLSNKPLKENELDLQGGIELLPEARAENLGHFSASQLTPRHSIFWN